MATRLKKETLSDEDTRQIAAQILSLEDDTINAESLNPALESLFAEMGVVGEGEAQVFVSKLDADGRGLEAAIWKGDPDAYDLEALAKKFGSGQYRVKVYVRVATGHKVKKADKVFAWFLSPEDEQKRLAAQNPVTSTPTIDIAGEVTRAVAQALQGLAPLLHANAAPPVNPMEMMQSMAGLMKTLMPAPTAPVVTSPQDPFMMMKNVIELTNMLKGESEPMERGANAGMSDVLLGLVNKFGPALAQAVAAGQPMGEQPALPAPHAGNQSVQPEGDDVNLRLKMGLKFLVQMADADADPVTYANMILDTVPSDDLVALMQQPDPLTTLGQFEPGILSRRVWFDKVIAECREMMKADEEESSVTSLKADTPAS